MNLFKSVFSDDPDPPRPESGSNNAPRDKSRDPDSPPRSSAIDSAAAGVGGDGWNFGGLIKTLTTKSESIIETYRRDLQEFGTGLKKEIEVAQGSLGTVGHVIDEFGNTVVKGTAQIISQGKDAILAVDLDSDSDNNSSNMKSLDSARYSRFNAHVRAIQGDVSTYSEEPEDLNEFNEWKLGFSLEGKGEEMEGLFRENDAMESVYKKVVPNTVDNETFWYRYYYKVYKLKKAEDVRARFVSGISGEDEDLSWDVEDDDDKDGDGKNRGEVKPVVMNKEVGSENVDNSRLHVGGSEGGTKRLDVEEESKEQKKDDLLQSEEVGNKVDTKFVEESQVEKSEFVGDKGGVDEASKSKADDDGLSKNDLAGESDEKVVKEREGGDEKTSSKRNESSVVEIQHSANEQEEEDLGWDDIEDLSSIDEKKTTQQSGGGASKVDLRKRLSSTEQEEDLSWDIEDDDDEPAKA
ncbi:BSD domain-containing protein 1 [Glycine soja]|uniref:BSD domain-containing protein 1 n=1 Tax=Glycine soja TaxID=3848 RepID=A0A445IGR4_GLYSO|nr:spore wall protein 2-like [Glycine soja]RZB85334.1 BSD domain-containing protein 1 [Glycine soja]